MNAESKLEQAASPVTYNCTKKALETFPGYYVLLVDIDDGKNEHIVKSILSNWQSLTTPASNDWKAKFHEWLSGRLDIPIPEMDLIISYVERYIAPSKPHTVEEGQTQEPAPIKTEGEDELNLLKRKLDFYRQETDKVRKLVFGRNDIGEPCQPLYDAIFDKIVSQEKEIERLKATPAPPSPVGIDVERIEQVLNLAQCELRSMYRKVGIIDSNILKDIDNVLEKVPPTSLNQVQRKKRGNGRRSCQT